MRTDTWHKIWARKYAPFMASAFIRSFVSPKWFSLCPDKLFIKQTGLYALFIKDTDWKKFKQKYINFLMRANLHSFERKYEQAFKKMLKEAKAIAQIPHHKLSNHKLIELLNKIDRWLVDSGNWQMLVWPVIEDVSNILEQKYAGNKQFLNGLGTPHKQTLIGKINTNLDRLAKIKKLPTVKLQSFAKTHAWIPVYEFCDKPWTINDFQKRIKEIKQHPVRKSDKQHLKYYYEFLNNVTNKDERKRIQIVHAFAYLKEMRDDYRRQAYFCLIPFWQEIAKRTGLSLEETNYLLAPELVKILKTGNNNFKPEILKRQNNYALLLKNNKLSIFSGTATKKISKMVQINPTAKKIKGTPAFAGKITGKICIVQHQYEFNKFQRGDILVTTMTHPEFVVIMNKAKAIITDEGGLTCHAAIVAREMKKPCIIGTKIATKVFKDGDMVEVNANIGTVKLINKN